MGQSGDVLKGPDLEKGVAVDSIAPGRKILGHAGGEPVLLVRESETFHAVGAKCSHYGGDLDAGLIAEGVVRCPWHHACFDLKTGDALKAPALNPIPTWRTEVENGTVYVRERKPSASAKVKVASEERFVIVGSGAAGHAASEALRRLGFLGRITILSADSDLPYDRPNLSKDYLAGGAPEEWMPLRSADFFADQKIEVRLNSRVIGIDPKTKTLSLERGESVHYDKCLIATGGTPFKPRIDGIGLPHVHVLRSFSDCRSLISDLDGAKKVVIVGAGFIGLEAAAALRTRQLNITIVAPGRFPLEHVVGPDVGAFLKALHERNGVRFRLGQSVERIEEGKVVLTDQTTEAADVVLVATGIRLSADFVQPSGIHFENGILVNEFLETSASDVFAAGDIARWPSSFAKEPLRIEHWVVAQGQGRTAAANMMGAKKKYVEVPFFWSQQFDVTLNYVGHAASPANSQIYGRLEDRDCTVAYRDGSEVRAVLTIGRDLQSLEIERAFESGDQESINRILSLGR